jgi:DNA-binding MarR family transcriptional regulator
MAQRASRQGSRRDESVADATSALLVASRALVGVAARSLAATEATITLPQYRALVLLASRGDQNVSSLADALGIHPSTTTRLCNRLAAKRLIKRATSSDSRREVTVTLSPAGQALLGSVTARRRNELKRIVARLDPEMRRALVDSLASFAEAAGEIPDDAWKLGWTA